MCVHGFTSSCAACRQAVQSVCMNVRLAVLHTGRQCSVCAVCVKQLCCILAGSAECVQCVHECVSSCAAYRQEVQTVYINACVQECLFTSLQTLHSPWSDLTEHIWLQSLYPFLNDSLCSDQGLQCSTLEHLLVVWTRALACCLDQSTCLLVWTRALACCMDQSTCLLFGPEHLLVVWTRASLAVWTRALACCLDQSTCLLYGPEHLLVVWTRALACCLDQSTCLLFGPEYEHAAFNLALAFFAAPGS